MTESIAEDAALPVSSRRISISNSTDSFVSFVDNSSIGEKPEANGTSEELQHANEPKKNLPKRDIESSFPTGYYGDLTRHSQMKIIVEGPCTRTRSSSLVIERSLQICSQIQLSSRYQRRRSLSMNSLTPSERFFLKPQTFFGFMAEYFGKFAGWMFDIGAPGYARGVAGYQGCTTVEVFMDERAAARRGRGRDGKEHSGW